jgi:serine/threonine-protein kinase RsbW
MMIRPWLCLKLDHKDPIAENPGNMSSSPKTNQVLLDIPAKERYLNLIGSCISGIIEREEDLPNPKELIFRLELAVREICNNIIEHAYAGAEGRIKIYLSIEEAPRRLVVDLYDFGRTFELQSYHQPNQHEPQTSGYGLFLVDELCSRVEYRSEGNINHWRLEKDF